jgi:predicted transcriptional regulator
MERTQIYLSKRETDALDRVARETGHTRSHLIREAIREKYGAAPDVEEKLRILRETFGAWERTDQEIADYWAWMRSGQFERKLEELERRRGKGPDR